MTRLAFVGLGHLGGHLAASLLRNGLTVTAFDIDDAALGRAVQLGAQRGASIADAAQATDAVLTCLPSPAAVAAVAAELLVTMPAGCTWIDMSTNDRDVTMAMARRCAEAGFGYLEAPVTGGVHKAAAGDITVLVGGSAHLAERFRPVLQAMGDPVLHVGDVGAAASIKVITNMLAFINLVGVGEALMLARQAGVDLAVAYQAIAHSSGASFVHETEGQLILSGSYNIAFTIDLACKDLGFATEMGRRLGVPLELGGLVEQTFIRARSAYGGGAWSTQVVKLLEDALATDLRAPGFPEVLQ